MTEQLPISYVAPGERTAPNWARAFAYGCGGGMVVSDCILRDGPVALFGSPKTWHILVQAQAEGRDWYYGDHAYFHRFRFYRACKNDYQHDGLKGEPANTGRWERLGIEIEPWKKNGRHVLLCPPDQPYAKLKGFDAVAWTDNVLATLKANTERPIRIRDRIGAERNPITLRMDLEGAHCLVTHHSNAAVEAVCFGYPVFLTGRCGATAMAEHDLTRIETPIYPRNRLRWAKLLASNQWTFDEIREGLAWRKLNGSV